MRNTVRNIVVAGAGMLVFGHASAQAPEKLAVPAVLAGKRIELIVP
jgi:hypothetical protein